MAETSTAAQKLAAEVLGTFVLVFVGCGAAIFSGGNYVATGLAFGLTVLVMVYAFGRVSGGHFNPAVSVGAAMGGRMAWRQVLVYVGAQLAGALVAGLALFILVHGFADYQTSGHLGQNSYGDAGSGFAWWSAFLLEAIMTAIFVWVILAVTDARNEHPVMAPLTIGLALAMIHFASIGATGTSVNPARSIGVGVFAGADAVIQLWLFILAPLLGGAVAGATYALIFGQDREPVPGSGFAIPRPAPAAVPGYGAPDQYQAEWNQQDPVVQGEAAAAQEGGGYAQQPGQQPGYQQPGRQSGQREGQQSGQHAAQGRYADEPIIQDGWQWDPHRQQWLPLPEDHPQHPHREYYEQQRRQREAQQQAQQQAQQPDRGDQRDQGDQTGYPD